MVVDCVKEKLNSMIFNVFHCSFLAGTPDTFRGIVYTNSVSGNSEREMGASQNLPFYHPILGLPDYLHLI